MNLLAGWGPALRVARRDCWRHKRSSALAVLLIALPVTGVTTAAIVQRTASISPAESAQHRLGAADALIYVGFNNGRGAVLQASDPEQTSAPADDTSERPPFTINALDGVLPDSSRAIPTREGSIGIEIGTSVVQTHVTEVDLKDPLSSGLMTLEQGAWPGDASEVVINDALVSRGFEIGDQVTISDSGTTPTVVGVARDATIRSKPVAAGPASSLLGKAADGDSQSWLVDAGGPVEWATVEAINELGALVVSRDVLTDPPPTSALPPEMRPFRDGLDPVNLAVVGLIAAMVLMEVVLLAGPAFAVGARRQSRTLALMAATGGTPRQARRVVLASAVVLGAVAAAIGVLLGLILAWTLLPAVQRFSSTWFGPFEIPWLVVAGTAAMGLLSALLAAIVPAFTASRQDIVAVLAGRRGDGAVSRRSPLLGVLILGVGVAGSVYGATRSINGEIWISASAILAVVGMLFLVPLVVAAVAKISGGLPLAVRYAARDAVRHRTRTVPAVAAVAATVAGVVTLSIAVSSDQRGEEEMYQAQAPMGEGSVTLSPKYTGGDNAQLPTQQDWSNVEAALEEGMGPTAAIQPLTGLVDASDGDAPLEVIFDGGPDPFLASDPFSLPVLVSDDTLPSVVSLTDESQRAPAEQALADGRVVVLTQRSVQENDVDVLVNEYEAEPQKKTLPAYFLEVEPGPPVASAVVPSAVGDELGAAAAIVAIALPDPGLSKKQEAALQEQLSGVWSATYLYIERGFQPDETYRIVLLVLGGLAGILMLGGTLTATFLALADARPDLATFAAVGASPRSRRHVGAAYALVIGLVGALLGAAVGFIPGLAIVHPLTSTSYYSQVGGISGPFYDIPWLMIGTLVVGLPLLTALIVALFSRSRLPMVARLE